MGAFPIWNEVFLRRGEHVFKKKPPEKHHKPGNGLVLFRRFFV